MSPIARKPIQLHIRKITTQSSGPSLDSFLVYVFLSDQLKDCNPTFPHEKYPRNLFVISLFLCFYHHSIFSLSIKKLMLIQMVQTLIPILINSNQEIILPLQN